MPYVTSLQQRRLFVLARLFGWNDHGGGYLVLIFQIEQAHALRSAARRAHSLGIDADDLAPLADDHQFAGVIDELNRVDAADARRHGHVFHALPAAGLEPVLFHIGALAEAVFRDGENAVSTGLVLLRRNGYADHVVIFGEVDAAHAVRGAAHRAHIALVEANCHTEMRRQEDQLRAVGDARGHKLIVLVDADGDNAAGHHVRKILERRLLYRPLLRGEEDVLALLFEIAHRQNRAHIFARLQIEQALDRLAFARRTHIGNLIDFEPVHAARVREAKQVSVRGIDDELRDEIFLARLHPGAASSAPPLLAIGGNRRTLQVALMAYRYGHLLVGNEVFELQLGAFVDDLRAPLVAVLVANLFELLHDH